MEALDDPCSTIPKPSPKESFPVWSASSGSSWSWIFSSDKNYADKTQATGENHQQIFTVSIESSQQPHFRLYVQDVLLIIMHELWKSGDPNNASILEPQD